MLSYAPSPSISKGHLFSFPCFNNVASLNFRLFYFKELLIVVRRPCQICIFEIKWLTGHTLPDCNVLFFFILILSACCTHSTCRPKKNVVVSFLCLHVQLFCLHARRYKAGGRKRRRAQDVQVRGKKKRDRKGTQAGLEGVGETKKVEVKCGERR